MRHIYTYTTLSLLLGCSGGSFKAGEITDQPDSGTDSFSAMGGNSGSGNNGSGGRPPQMDGGTIEEDSGEKSNSGGSENSGGNVGDGGNSNDMDSGVGGANTGGMTGSDGGNGGSGGEECQPKNCLDIALDLTDNTEEKACGFVDDGCGNLINCGGCAHPDSECGGNRYTYNGGSFEDLQIFENICGTGCLLRNGLAPTNACANIYAENTVLSQIYYCNENRAFQDNPPFDGCVIGENTLNDWCCPKQ